MVELLFPEALLDELRERCGSDVAAVYLSEPASPFDRSSYLILGAAGALPAYAPYLRGPLKPESVELFSAADGLRELIVPDVALHPHFSKSAFGKAHRVRSLIRLSVRAADFESVTPFARLPVLFEVFLDFRAPRDAEALRAIAAAARDFLEQRMPAIHRHAPLVRLLNVRATARKHRRLDRIARGLAGLPDLDSRLFGAEQPLRKAIEMIGRFVLDCCGVSEPDARVDLWRCARSQAAGAVAAEFERIGPEPKSSPRDLARGRADARHVAVESGNSIVLDGRQRLSWRGKSVAVPGPGASVTLPLFAGRRVVAVLQVRARTPALDRTGLAMLWRMVPQIEQILATVFLRQAAIDAVETRAASLKMTTLPLAPRDIAIETRLKRLGLILRSTTATLLEYEEGQLRARTWPRGAESTAVIGDDAAKAAFFLFGKDSPLRALLVEHDGGAAVRAWTKRLTGRARPMRPAEPQDEAVKLARMLETDRATTAGTQARLFLPLRLSDEGSEREHFVAGILLLCYAGAPPAPTPAWIDNADTLARTFGAALLLIEKFAQRAALIGWASAGVGPIHQLVKVLEACREEALALADDPGAAARLTARIEVVYEQLWLLHQFSRETGSGPSSALEEPLPLAAVVESAVAKAMWLIGKTRPPEIAIEPRAAAARVPAATQTAVNAVLSCAISNSARYGIGFSRVLASADAARGVATIRVVNHTERPDAREHLEDARRIAERVAAGAGASVFERLCEEANERGLRGIGTWIAARVTRELLGGRYAIEFRPVEDAPGRLEVTATIEVPVQKAAARKRRERGAMPAE